MRPSENTETCPDCGGVFTMSDAGGHKYMGGSAGCWAVYNEILRREYEDAAFFASHRFTVDAYAVQHPGDQSDRRAKQSVNIHLAALYAMFEEKRPKSDIPRLLKTLANKHQSAFKTLTPPLPSAYELTVNDLLPARTASEHQALIYSWAENVWQAWKIHHDHARELAALSPSR